MLGDAAELPGVFTMYAHDAASAPRTPFGQATQGFAALANRQVAGVRRLRLEHQLV